MKKSLIALAAVLSVILVSGSAFAASSKVAMQVSNEALITQQTNTVMAWTPILTTTLHMPSNQSLLITPSLETALYTNTQVASNGNKSTASASAQIRVKCVITDPNGNQTDALPTELGNGVDNGVAYDCRIQTLSATLQGIITGATANLTTGQVSLVTEPSIIDLILQTQSAHSFNFMFPNVSAGDYTVTVYAMIDTLNGTSPATSGDLSTLTTTAAQAWAAIGVGSLSVEDVGIVNDGTEISM